MTKLIDQLRQLERLDQLIRLKATGSPKDLARKLDVSLRTVYNLLDGLKSFGAEICYCRERCSYYYENEIKFQFDIVLSMEDRKNMKGGNALLKLFHWMHDFCTVGKHFCWGNVVNRNLISLGNAENPLIE
ncbi:MAG: HTH domain-containing protein [Saprospiraceae bacterium]|nr:HTH domain-containing protein [Saprospiraceae bacterium]MCB9323501.1 HTH domain-containing protein [Lewinellaceae bacterium]